MGDLASSGLPGPGTNARHAAASSGNHLLALTRAVSRQCDASVISSVNHCSSRTLTLPRRWECPKPRSEEHTSELQSLMRISYAVFCLKKKKHNKSNIIYRQL